MIVIYDLTQYHCNIVIYKNIPTFYFLKMKQHILIIDAEHYTDLVITKIFKTRIVDEIHQISVRLTNEDNIKVDYKPILCKLRKFYDHGFRIFWFDLDYSCVSRIDRKRTNCMQIDMVSKSYNL